MSETNSFEKERREKTTCGAVAAAVEGSDACVVSRRRFGVLVGAGRGTTDRVAYSIIKTAAAQPHSNKKKRTRRWRKRRRKKSGKRSVVRECVTARGRFEN